MIKLNADQAKHAANSLRVIGMAQFAAYGYTELQSPHMDIKVLVASGLVYISLEIISMALLGRAS